MFSNEQYNCKNHLQIQKSVIQTPLYNINKNYVSGVFGVKVTSDCAKCL